MMGWMMGLWLRPLHAESSAIGCNAELNEIKIILIIPPINALGWLRWLRWLRCLCLRCLRMRLCCLRVHVEVALN
jgi:hypothetical protein